MIRSNSSLAAGDGKTIASGQSIAAAIDHPGDIDGYTFSASAGDSFVVSAGTAGSSVVQPYVQVFAPDGTRVINDSTFGSSVIDTYQVAAGKAGTYTVVVASLSDKTGAYAVEMIRSNSSLAAGDGKPTASGQTINAAIDHPGDIDGYTFAASAGDSFVVSAGITGSSVVQPYVQVFASDGTRVVNDSTFGSSVIDTYQVAAGQGGTFTIVVASLSDKTGAYAVEMIRSNSSLAAGDGKAITSGPPINAAIDHPGDIDGYTFSASAGDSFVVSQGATGSSVVQPYLQVFAPDGTRVVNDLTFGSSVMDTYQIPSGKSGTYTIVAASLSDKTGAYALTLSGNLHPVTPTITVTAPAAQSATAGVSKSFSLGSFKVSNATGPYSVDINWGDGSAHTKVSVASPGTIPAQSHSYAAAGAKTVSIIVSDSASHKSNTATFAVNVVGGGASIAGNIFKDTNANGGKDSGETNLSAVKVYLDANKNGAFDSGEKTVNTDDLPPISVPPAIRV